MNRTVQTAIVLSAIFALALPAFANHSWNGYHWARQANPFTLTLGDNVSSAWDGYLATASNDWSVSTVLDTNIAPGGTSAKKGKNTPKNCVPTAGRVEVCNASYGKNGWLGIAQVWIDADNHITQGTAKMNDSYFSRGSYNTPAWRHLVMCQEVAHTFGLDHQDETFDNVNLGTCMDYTDDPDGGAGGASADDLSNEHPNQHDYDELVEIYSHEDSGTTLLQEAAKAFGRATAQIAQEEAGASEWGHAVRADGQGRANVFEKDLGGGAKVITHVFWAR